MATPFDRLMATLRPHLPGAIDEAVRLELFMACKEFFSKSSAWQEALDFLVLRDDKAGEIMPFAGTIERLMHVTMVEGSTPVYGVTLGQQDLSGAAPIYLRSAVNQPTLYTATVALTVSDPTTRDAYPIVPAEIVKRYTEELMHGVIARMMAQPNKPYTNLSLAQFHLLKFRGGTMRAKNAIMTGNTQGSQAWRFPQTFSRRK